MTNHDITTNERIAKIMGWIYDAERDCFINRREGCIDVCIHAFNPLEDPTYDCIVLKHIRENWDDDGLDSFKEQLEFIWQQRPVWEILAYEPGDYSLAALKVIEESNG